MEITKKKLDFTIGIFDNISENIKSKIVDEAKKSQFYGIGVYTDTIVIEEYMTYPERKIDERINCVKQLEGVDFVFKVDSIDKKEIKKVVVKSFEEFLKDRKEIL